MYGCTLMRVLMLDREGFKDTKGEIRICKSRKVRQHNGQKILVLTMGIMLPVTYSVSPSYGRSTAVPLRNSVG